MEPNTFRAVPFDENWVTSDKVDVHAIYRRPILDELGEQQIIDGVPQWDLTGGLPVKRHRDWTKKGFEYVTLSDFESLNAAAPGLKARGLNPGDFVNIRNRSTTSPWNPALYFRSAGKTDREHVDAFQKLVEQLGSEAVRAVMRATKDPNYELPAHLRNIPPAGSTAAESGAAG